MKKAFLTIVLSLAIVAAFAQKKSVDVKWGMNNFDSGFAVGLTYALGDSFEFAPSASLYFPGESSFGMTVEADLHYLLEDKVSNLELFPIVGVGFSRYTYKNADDDWKIDPEFLVNVGMGARYNFSDQWAVLAEEKLQYVDGINSFFSVGISYKF